MNEFETQPSLTIFCDAKAAVELAFSFICQYPQEAHRDITYKAFIL